jgi:hypothetical protein
MVVMRPSDDLFLQVDDPVFTPVWDWLARSGHTLIAHIGEPRACWEPLGPANPHHAYYSRHPEHHLYGKPSSVAPSHAALIAARNGMLAAHPGMRVVGAHLGSEEYDVAAIDATLSKYVTRAALLCNTRRPRTVCALVTAYWATHFSSYTRRHAR